MSTDQVNYLNIGLMLASLVAAFILPFEVFLLSYAILGPLHYLTEISWLHDRNYFSQRKLDWIPLVMLGLLILLGAQVILGETVLGWMNALGLDGMVRFLSQYSYDITFVAFGLALIFVVFRNWSYRIAAMVVLLVAAWAFSVSAPETITNQRDLDKLLDKYGNPMFKIFGVYLPTLIHVYLFTGAFILFGALKRDSRTGYFSFGVFILCAISCFLFFTGSAGYSASNWAVNYYDDSFRLLSVHFLDDFFGMNYPDAARANLFTNPASIITARFIAFAYTYHYLNWFSKTSVIRWHKVPKLRFAIVVAAWVASVGLYFYDYNTGFRWLFLLSFLHVLLEFPLNHQSFIGIGSELRKRVFPRPQKVAPKRTAR